MKPQQYTNNLIARACKLPALFEEGTTNHFFAERVDLFIHGLQSYGATKPQAG